MQANDVYALALSFLSEKTQQNPLGDFSLNWLNLLLAEALPYENSLREARGEQALEQPPVLTDYQQEVPYSERIVRIALPYGLAEFMFCDDGDLYQAEKYRQRYVSALKEAQKYIICEVEDVYAGETEETGGELDG